MSTEAQKKASANYAKKMTKCVNLAFNKKTDADILEKLDHVESKMGYIKKLIRDDIEKAKKGPEQLSPGLFLCFKFSCS